MSYTKEQATDKLRILREEAGGKCVDCASVEKLQFHHVEKKNFEISSTYRSLGQLREELKKCVLLCASCHVERHIPAHGTYSRYRKRGCRCEACCKVYRDYHRNYYHRTKRT